MKFKYELDKELREPLLRALSILDVILQEERLRRGIPAKEVYFKIEREGIVEIECENGRKKRIHFHYLVIGRRAEKEDVLIFKFLNRDRNPICILSISLYGIYFTIYPIKVEITADFKPSLDEVYSLLAYTFTFLSYYFDEKYDKNKEYLALAHAVYRTINLLL